MATKNSKDKYYVTWPTAWGHMGAVANDKGLTRIILPSQYRPDDLAALVAWEHQKAVCDKGPFERLIELTRDYFNGKVTDFAEIACDIPAETAFTGKVYRACREIPYGQTRSYLDLSKAIGTLDSARAVATAMSKNRIPLVIPCHRVIYSSGKLGGFSAEGGEEVKKRMLKLEKAI